MAIEIDLGCAKFESRSNGVQLTLTSSAQFAASGEDEVDLKRILTGHILNQNSGSRLWIHGGNGFKLVISLQIDGNQRELLPDQAAESFAHRLRSAKWWDQLQFSASSIRVISTSDQVRQIEVLLRHEDFAIDQSKRQLHKLDTGVPFHHVKPPAGLRQTALCEVSLTITAKKQRNSKRRRTTKSLNSQMPSAHSTMSSATLETERSSTNHAFREASELDVLQRGESEDAFLLHDCRDHDWLIESDDEESFEDEDGMLFYDCVVPPLNMTDTLPLPLRSSKRASDDVDLRADDEDTAMDITSDTILELIDAAVRLALTGSTTSKPEFTVVRQAKSIRSLAKVVPSLWSPGHLPAVASRARFLPTVCHAFSTVCSNNSKTEVMQTRRTVLLAKYGKGTSGRCCSDGNQPDIDADHETFWDSTAVHLWQMMQAHLYDPRAARRLRPLHTDSVQMDATELLLQFPLEDQDGTEYCDADEIDEGSDDSSLLDDDSYYDDADFDDDFYDLAAETSLFESDQLHEPNDCCTLDKSHASEHEHDSTRQLCQIESLETLSSSRRPANKDREILNSDDDLVEYSDDEVLSIGMTSVSMNEVDGSGLSPLEQEDRAASDEEMLCG